MRVLIKPPLSRRIGAGAEPGPAEAAGNKEAVSPRSATRRGSPDIKEKAESNERNDNETTWDVLSEGEGQNPIK